MKLLLKRSPALLLSAALFCLLWTAVSWAAEGHKSVAILPFTLHAPQDKQYLQEGIRDILGSRISAETGSVIIPRTKVTTALQDSGGRLNAKNMGPFAKKLGADYLIYGSITALGGGLSLDVRVFSVSAPVDQAVRTFYGSAVTNDQIMRSIDTLAWDILEQLFHKKRPSAMIPVPQTAVQSGISAFTTIHPDKAFMASGGGYNIRGGRNFVKTRNFTMSLKALALGDVDGDGKAELVLAGPDEVRIFRRNGTRLNLLGVVKMGPRYLVHNVNVADINGNGRAEIYISAADPKIPGSRIVEWDGQKFVELAREIRWYIRPLNVPGMGLILAGQQAGLLPVEPGIYRLEQNNGKITAGKRLAIPAKINLFNFAYADLDGDGQYEIVSLDDSFKLHVIRGGVTIWTSEQRFCGTKRFIGGTPNMMPGTSHSRNDEVEGIGERYVETYIPSRILISDVDHDGVDDIVVNRNPSTLTTVMPREIQYKSGTLVGLKWNGLGLGELWRTRKIDGYVVDYQAKSQVMKLGPDVKDEIFIGVVLNSGTLDSLLRDQSTVVIYPFEFEQQKEKNQ